MAAPATPPPGDYGSLLPPGPPGAVITLEALPGGGFRATPVTQGVAEFLEFSCEELADRLARRALPLADPDEAPAFYAAVAAAVAARAPWESVARYTRPVSGAPRWVHTHALPVPGDRPRWSVQMVDVTAARAADEERRRTLQKYRRYVETTPLAVIEWDAFMRVADWSARAEELFGWTLAEVRGLAPSEFPIVHPDDAPRIDEVCDDLMAGAPWRGVVRNRNLSKDGRTLHCEWYNSVLTDEAGRVLSVLSLVQDVTDRALLLDAAGRSELRMRSALGMAGMLGWEMNLRANEAHFSGDLWAFHGEPPPVAPPPNALAYFDGMPTVHPNDQAAVRAAVTPALGPAGGEFRVEYRNAAGDRWFVSRGRVLADAAGPERILGVITEVTAQRGGEKARAEAERQLQEARRLESLALLAGGVAHDLNNLLTVILGNAELLRARAAPGPDRDALAEIDGAVQRAAELCRQMTAYAGTGRVKVHALDLNALLAESGAALRDAAGPAARLEVRPGASAPSAHADPAQVRQLLLNLARNAGEALGPAGGSVVVESGERDVAGPADAEGFEPPPRPGRYAVLTVRDDGPGFDPAVLAKLFQPFVSTRGAGRGLGLAAVAGIVRAHRGAVRVESRPAAGTAVTVLLPRGASAPATPPPRVAVAPVRRSAGLVLVVDDEPNIRELAAATLEDHGFAVAAADDADAGWRAFAARPADFALAVVDLQLPDANGAELLQRARAVRPDLPAVIITGFTTRELPEELCDERTTAVLMKPFPLERLAALAARLTGAAE